MGFWICDIDQFRNVVNRVNKTGQIVWFVHHDCVTSYPKLKMLYVLHLNRFMILRYRKNLDSFNTKSIGLSLAGIILAIGKNL